MMLAALQSSVTATLRRFATRGLQSTGEPSAPQAPTTKPPTQGAGPHLGLGVELAVLEPTLQGDPPAKAPPPPSATTPPDATLRQGATPRGATPVAMPSAPVAFEVLGATVGCYQVLGHYASGGMCQVYRARHLSLGYECAFKVPFPPGSSEDRRRLKREARLGAMLSHPSVVKFLDFGHLPDRRPYLVMEMLEGPSLRQALVGRPFEIKRACRIANQVAAGLSALHAQGIVHRDIKPRNLLLDSRGGEQVKIIDLGLAKRPVVALDLMVSMQGVILGTPDYMGPEQRRGEDVDPRTDQYALGCVFFEMLTGKAVADYPSEEPARPGAPQLGELLRHDLPKGLIQVVQRMLAEDPKNRYQMMSQVENALRPFV